MQFSKNVKQTINLLLTFIFILNTTLNASIAITAEQRPVEMGSFIRNSDRPSDLPVAAYSDFFEKETINIIENMDLSNYSDMKGFIGYGIYDVKENQCQYLEIPNKGKAEFDTIFEKYGTHNGHTYGISRNTMTYNQCLSIGAEYGGTPVAVDSTAENFYVEGVFATNGFGEVWVGATKNTCSDPYYTSGIGRTQFYTNWKNLAVESTCSDFQKSVKMELNGKWDKVNGENTFKCVIEWESDTIYRPVKICAPWWKINREYKNTNLGLYSEKELARINQADLPATLNICTRYDANAAAAIDKPHRDVTCTSYYSRTAAPECARDIMQDQCYVNECQGYLQNVCRQKAEEIVGKGYVKGQIMLAGSKVSVKIKDQVKTHVYDCPPSPPSMSKCLDTSNVMIWPKECPDSTCTQLKECYLAATDEASLALCEDTYKCEKIYASRDIPPMLDTSGNVIELYGTCEDGTQLTFFPNILDKQNRVCEEYETYTVTEQITQKCTVSKPVNDYHVNVAFTASDIYENDPNCLRTDKVEDSQRMSEVSIDIKNNGYFKHKISKVNLDDTVDLIYNGGTDTFLLAQAFAAPNTGVPSTPFEIQECNIDLQCGNFDNRTNVYSFQGRTQDILMTGTIKNSDINGLDLNTHKFKVFNITQSECEDTSTSSYASVHGFQNQIISSVSTINPITHITTCEYTFKSTSLDSELDYVSTLDGTQLVYKLSGNMTKDNCTKKAVCIGGTFNETNFGSNPSSIGVCTIVSGSYPESYMTYLKAAAGCVDTPIPAVSADYCSPLTSTASGFTSINGLESILVFEDYLTGSWGYYSNFATKLPKQNEVKLTTADYTEQAAFPLIEISAVKDYQQYVEEIYHESALASNPDYVAGAGAAAAGAAATYAAAQVATLAALGATGIGIAVVVIIVVVLMVMSRPKKMNRQDTHWTIFKHIDPDLYHSSFENRNYVENDTNVGSHNPSFYTIQGNNQNYIYAGNTSYTGLIEPSQFKNKLAANLNEKEKIFQCGGWNTTNFNIATHASEKGIIVGYPSCPWYNPWCSKTDSYDWTVDTVLNKDVNTIYYGADQSLTVLLPYRGSFLFEAYDKYDNLLSTTTLTEDSFINVFSADSLKFAQVKFGAGMQLSNSVTANACRLDPMVEWGGGVSGAYHENKTTGLNSNCEKSNDTYVEDHAMTKIVITPTNMENESFTYTLTKPLPFANRIYAATLDKLQDRYYRCYGEFPECSDENFQEQ